MNSSENVFGKRLRVLRQIRDKKESSQKEFAAMLGIPQPTLSAYESGRIKPTVDAIINIADKCHVSMDWLCGRGKEFSLNNLGDVMACFFELYETKEIKIETTVHDKVGNEDVDSPNDEDRNWVLLKVYINEAQRDSKLTLNMDLAKIIKIASSMSRELREYECSQESYDREKAYEVGRYQDVPITKVNYSDLTDKQRKDMMYELIMKKHEPAEKKVSS